jgi:hypothetical protein
MSMILLKALAALVPASIVFLGSVVSFLRHSKTSSLLQLVGAGCLLVMVVTHIFEALDLLRFMGWGRERTLGHYVDLLSAGLGLTLFPAGHLLQAVDPRDCTSAKRGRLYL